MSETRVYEHPASPRVHVEQPQSWEHIISELWKIEIPVSKSILDIGNIRACGKLNRHARCKLNIIKQLQNELYPKEEWEMTQTTLQDIYLDSGTCCWIKLAAVPVSVYISRSGNQYVVELFTVKFYCFSRQFIPSTKKSKSWDFNFFLLGTHHRQSLRWKMVF